MATAPSRIWTRDAVNPWPVTVLWACAFVFTVIEVTNVTFGAFHLSFKQMWLPPLLIAALIILRRFSLTLAFMPHLNVGMFLVLGWALLSALEWHTALGALPPGAKLVNGLFMSITPRTAGFNSVDYSQASDAGNFFTILLMVIGGSPGSTAGRTTTS